MTTTKNPVVVKNADVSLSEWREVMELKRCNRRALQKCFLFGMPLNKRLRKIWAEIQNAALAAEAAAFLAEDELNYI